VQEPFREIPPSRDAEFSSIFVVVGIDLAILGLRERRFSHET
jgi:hypothetical protein